jgi:hypothetical protein
MTVSPLWILGAQSPRQCSAFSRFLCAFWSNGFIQKVAMTEHNEIMRSTTLDATIFHPKKDFQCS